MISFAIVGNIASGKSTVENILQEKGYKVFDTDIIAHEVLNDFAEEIINQFDGHDISENGKVSREKLGKIVFNDKNKLRHASLVRLRSDLGADGE